MLDVHDGRAGAAMTAPDHDWQGQAESMRASGLPSALAETIETGWWATCLQILPPANAPPAPSPMPQLAARRARPHRGWANRPSRADQSELPVTPLFGSPYFPSRLWLYTNFRCNLVRDYCAVASTPKADPRSLSLDRLRDLVDETIRPHARGLRCSLRGTQHHDT